MARGQEPGGLNFLHIGKTGGTTIKKMVRASHLRRGPNGISLVMHNHSTTLPAVLGADPANTAVFFLRDPATRFVSGFNSRLREGKPAKEIPWKPEEKLAFETFPTPNELAEALSSEDTFRQDQAYFAMDAMVHTRMHYTRWLRDVDYLESRLDRIAFIGFQETYAEDVARFFRLMGVKDTTVEHHHQAPSTSSTTLSELGLENVKRWWAEDYVIFEWAKTQRHRWDDSATQ